jgi:DNA-binding transcriptional regulator YhcF (GntR family)
MKVYPFHKIISIDRDSTVPYYVQIANCILKAMEAGKLQNDDVLPSINELSHRMDIARDTAENAYKYLKRQGVIDAINGKGYFIKSTQPVTKVRVLLLFNQPGSFKRIIYDSFVKHLGDTAAIDFHVYNNNFSQFKKILGACKKDYDHYVILPGFADDAGDLLRVLNELPREKLIVAGTKIRELTGRYSGVYENFENDIYQALEQALEPLRKYHTISLIYPETWLHHSGIIMGLWTFCCLHGFRCHVITDMAGEEVGKGITYITVRDDDLVTLVERIAVLGLTAAKDVGVISYNETPLKKFILNGVTTISTDFKLMGEQMARLITGRSVEQTETRSYVTFRNSL